MSVLGFRKNNDTPVSIDTLKTSYSQGAQLPSDVMTDDGTILKKRIVILKDPDGTDHILGSGGYGTVYQAKLYYDYDTHSEGMQVAVKFPTYLLNSNYIRISETGEVLTDSTRKLIQDDEKLKLFYKEINTLLILRKGNAFLPLTAPNQHIRSSMLSRAFIEEDRLISMHTGHEFIHRILDLNKSILPCLISEFCHGDLLQVNGILKGKGLIQHDNLYTEYSGHWMNAVYEIYQGISYMHSIGISHNDIKPDNIFFLIQRECPLEITYRISDFGLCSDNTPLDEPRGTVLYMSPETREEYVNRDTSSHPLPFSNDAYTLGFTCLELLFMSSSYLKDSTTSTLNTQNFIDGISKETRYTWGDDTCNILFNLLTGLCVLPPNERLQVFEQQLSIFFTKMNHHT